MTGHSKLASRRPRVMAARDLILTLGCLLSLLTAVPVAAVELVDESVLEPVFQSTVLVVQAGVGNEHPVVLVHGLGDAGHEDWSAQIEALAEHHHVVTFDLPGFGRSEKQNICYTPRLYAAFLKWVVDRYVGDRGFTLVGHSMGGAIALRYAATFPRGIESLVLIDVAGILHEAAFTKFHALARIDHLLGDHPWTQNAVSGLTRGLLHRMKSPVDMESILGNPSLRSKVLGGDPTKIAAVGLLEEDFSRLVGMVQVPTLLIWGSDDEVAPLRVGHLLVSRLADASLQVLPDTGHTPMTEQPEVVNSLLAAVLPGAGPGLPVVGPESESDEQEAEDEQPSPEPDASDSAEHGLVTMAARDGSCVEEDGASFSGTYRRIEIERCKNVHLTGVIAKELVIRSSQVELLDCELQGTATPLVVRDSVVQATNLVVQGTTPLLASQSKLDLAGAELRGSEVAIRSEGVLHLLPVLAGEPDLDRAPTRGHQAQGGRASLSRASLRSYALASRVASRVSGHGNRATGDDG